jgi:hypothetical protein
LAVGTVTAGHLLKIWSFRLKMNDAGVTKWVPSMRAFAESLVDRLRSLDTTELISIDADENRDPIARFIRVNTGEVLAEMNQPSASSELC